MQESVRHLSSVNRSSVNRSSARGIKHTVSKSSIYSYLEKKGILKGIKYCTSTASISDTTKDSKIRYYRYIGQPTKIYDSSNGSRHLATQIINFCAIDRDELLKQVNENNKSDVWQYLQEEMRSAAELSRLGINEARIIETVLHGGQGNEGAVVGVVADKATVDAFWEELKNSLIEKDDTVLTLSSGSELSCTEKMESIHAVKSGDNTKASRKLRRLLKRLTKEATSNNYEKGHKDIFRKRASLAETLFEVKYVYDYLIQICAAHRFNNTTKLEDYAKRFTDLYNKESNGLYNLATSNIKPSNNIVNVEEEPLVYFAPDSQERVVDFPSTEAVTALYNKESNGLYNLATSNIKPSNNIVNVEEEPLVYFAPDSQERVVDFPSTEAVTAVPQAEEAQEEEGTGNTTVQDRQSSPLVVKKKKTRARRVKLSTGEEQIREGYALRRHIVTLIDERRDVSLSKIEKGDLWTALLKEPTGYFVSIKKKMFEKRMENLLSKEQLKEIDTFIRKHQKNSSKKEIIVLRWGLTLIIQKKSACCM